MKRYLLPIIAGIVVIAAVVVIVAVPNGGTSDNPSGGGANAGGDPASMAAVSYLETTADGNLWIDASTLSSSAVLFVRVSPDSNIELLARIGDDGMPKVALGTCQSCNGSPKAYYVQDGDVLRCSNCGLTFPLSVVDAPGGGCHPIMIDEAVLSITAEGILLDADTVASYEPLFSKVAAH